MARGIGLDFGTTNSALAVTEDGRSATLARFRDRGGWTDTFRSVLFFHPDNLDAERQPKALAGAAAIEGYLQTDGSGRLLQSMKSFLASRLFTSTRILGCVFSLEELIACAVREIKAAAQQQFGALDGPVVVGRPVRFASADGDADDDFAVERLRAALQRGGFEDVGFEYEPVGAAYHYESTLDHDEVILIADFGGGTSDFCLMRVGPGVRRRGRVPGDIIGTDGVGVAGDVFDSRIVRHLVVPRLGYGSSYRTLFGRIMPMPAWIYGKLERWHYLSVLKSRETMQTLRELRAQALDPEKIDALIHVVEYDLGFHLYRAVEHAKVELSGDELGVFELDEHPVRIRDPLTRRHFEEWIAPELSELAACVERLLRDTGVSPRTVDRVFLTGGTSFVPAVRQLFETRFGTDRLRTGDELTSVARGLALCAADRERA